jgi:hypothetical protein
MLAVGGSFKETDIAMVDCASSSSGMGEGFFVSGFLVVGEGVALVFVVGLGTTDVVDDPLLGGLFTGDGALDNVGTDELGDGTLLSGSFTGDGALDDDGTNVVGDGDATLLGELFTGDGELDDAGTDVDGTLLGVFALLVLTTSTAEVSTRPSSCARVDHTRSSIAAVPLTEPQSISIAPMNEPSFGLTRVSPAICSPGFTVQAWPDSSTFSAANAAANVSFRPPNEIRADTMPATVVGNVENGKPCVGRAWISVVIVCVDWYVATVSTCVYRATSADVGDEVDSSSLSNTNSSGIKLRLSGTESSVAVVRVGVRVVRSKKSRFKVILDLHDAGWCRGVTV